MSEFLRGYETCYNDFNAELNKSVKILDENPNFKGAVDAVNSMIKGAHQIKSDLNYAKKLDGGNVG